IKRIDASKALAFPGVRAVVTRADFPPVPEGAAGDDEGPATPLPFLVDRMIAGKKALFRGHPVAAVCATDPHIADDAVDLIEVEYEVLPAVFNVRDAMLDVAPVLHDDLRTRVISPLNLEAANKPTNIASHRQQIKGDVEAGFKEAEIVIEREFE